MKQDFGKYPQFARENSFPLTTLYKDNSTSGLEVLELICECGLFAKIKENVTGSNKNILLTMRNISWPLPMSLTHSLSHSVCFHQPDFHSAPYIYPVLFLSRLVYKLFLKAIPTNLHSVGSFSSPGLSSNSFPQRGPSTHNNVRIITRIALNLSLNQNVNLMTEGTLSN